MNKGVLIIGILFLVVFLITNVHAATYYVDNQLTSSCVGQTYSIVNRDCSGSDGYGNQYIKQIGNTVSPGDTIYVREGIYTGDYFWPLNSGTQAEPITVKSYMNEKPVFQGAGYWDSFIYIGWQGSEHFIIEGLSFEHTTGDNIIFFDNAFNNIIRNCSFFNHTGSMMNIRRSDFNIIEDNYFDTTGDPSDAGSGDHIYLVGSDNNLIQNNYFTRAGHASIDMVDYISTEYCDLNVIRNNTIEQHWGSGIGILSGSERNLIEHNKVFYVGEGVVSYPKSAVQIVSNNNIIRRNIVSDTSTSPYADTGMVLEGYIFSGKNQDAIGNKVYNNIVHKSGKQALFVTQRQDRIVTDNEFLNNIFYRNKVAGPYEEWFPDGNYYIVFEIYHSYPSNKWTSFPNNNYFHHNIMLHADSSQDYPGEDPFIFYDHESWGHSLAWVENNYPVHFYNNLEVNPGFSDANSFDFTLNPSSQAIDAGDYLTSSVGSGSMTTTLNVEDAGFFSDGFGITQGDPIVVEGNSPVEIESIDYETNTIVVSDNIDYSNGDYVSLLFSGSAPDIGVYEYAGGGSTCQSLGYICCETCETGTEQTAYDTDCSSQVCCGACGSSSSCGAADTSGNSIIEIGELLSYISDWKAGTVVIGDLLTAIGEWKNGC